MENILKVEHIEEDLRRKQDEQAFSKECERRGYTYETTFKDIICENDRTIVSLLLKVKDSSYITKFRDVDGNSLLEIVFQHCCSESIKALEQSDLEFSVNYEKLVALNKRSVINLLMKLRKNHVMDYLDDYGNTLLHIASKNGLIHSVKPMAYCELRNITNNDNKLPVDLAIETGNKTIIDLLNKNIDVKGITKEYDKAENKVEYLEDLISSDKRDDINVLLSNYELIKEYERTLLHNAARNNNVHLFKLFTQYGCNIELRGLSGGTCLHIAAQHGCKEMLMFIIKKCPQMVNVKNNKGETILHLAVCNGNKEMMMLIIEKCPQMVHVKNNNGDTILHYAARNFKKEGLLLILEKYPKLTDVKNNNGETILHFAVWYSSEDMMMLILEKYPQMADMKNNKSETILHYAARNSKKETMMLLLERYPLMADVKNSNGETILHFAAQNSKEMVKLILDKYPKMVGKRNYDGETCLHHAARNGNEEVVMLILKTYSQMVNVKNHEGETFLHLAAWYGKDDMVKAILEKYPEMTGMKNDDRLVVKFAPVQVTE